MFVLDAQLAEDTILIGNLPLCSVRLMNNSLYPWLIIVPERDEVVEIADLTESDRVLLIEEIAQVTSVMKEVYWPDKINVAALGNVVPQLHVHIIARFKTDDAWPDPIWGKGVKPYTEQSIEEAVSIISRECKKLSGFGSVIANEP